MRKKDIQRLIRKYFPYGNFSQYVIVLLTGVVLILLTVFMPFNKTYTPIAKEDNTTTGRKQEHTLPQTTAYYRTTASVSSSTTTSAPTTMPEKTTVPEKETVSEKTDSALAILSEEIIDSSYQSVNGYTWEEIYSLMVTIGQTSPMDQGLVCGFNLLYDVHSTPLLLIGRYDPENKVSDMMLYVAENGNIYELLQMNGVVFYSPSRNVYYVDAADVAYQYVPHVMKKIVYQNQSFPDDVILLPITDAMGKVITNDNIADYLTTFGEGMKS